VRMDRQAGSARVSKVGFQGVDASDDAASRASMRAAMVLGSSHGLLLRGRMRLAAESQCACQFHCCTVGAWEAGRVVGRPGLGLAGPGRALL